MLYMMVFASLTHCFARRARSYARQGFGRPAVIPRSHAALTPTERQLFTGLAENENARLRNQALHKKA